MIFSSTEGGAGRADAIAEEGRHDNGSTNEEKNGSKEHQDRLRKAFLTCLHLDIDNSGIVDSQELSDGIQKADDITHRQHDFFRHLSQSLSSQGIIDTTIADRDSTYAAYRQ